MYRIVAHKCYSLQKYQMSSPLNPPSINCPVCLKPKTKSGSGLITQFIEVCKCDSQAREEQEVSLCSLCKKRKRTASGSMTQWVFRYDVCQCADAIPPQTDEASTERKREIVDSESRQVSADEELFVRSDSFPLDRFKPLKVLGRGAAGVVYLARDRLLGKKVAVKTLHRLTKEQLIAFQEEARSTCKLSHENVVKVLDFGACESGAPYMVMELIVGESLESYLARAGSASEEFAAYTISQLCLALSYAHSHGIYHRDIKPGNILLAESDGGAPCVKLIDFGIAKVKEATGSVTEFQNKTLAGTPAYLPPDPVLGYSYDVRSEVYSLGCVLFELIVGEPPFIGGTALETISLHVNSPPRSLADAGSDVSVSGKMEDVVARCLRKNPEERIQSPEELREALQFSTMVANSMEAASDRKKATLPWRIVAVLVPCALMVVCAAAYIVSLLDPSIEASLRKDDQYFNEKAWEQVEEGQLREAMKNANRALSIKMSCASLDTRGMIYILLGDTDKALRDLNKAIALKRRDGTAYFHRGIVYEKLGDKQRSTADVLKAGKLGYMPGAWEREQFGFLLARLDAKIWSPSSALVMVTTPDAPEFFQRVGNSLTIKNNDLTKDSALQKLRALEKISDISLSGCAVSGQTFAMLTHLPLEIIYMYDCDQKKKNALSNLGQFRALKIFTALCSDITEVTFPKDLEFARVEGSAVSNNFLRELSRLKGLQTLSLSSLNLVDQDLSSVNAATNISHLQIEDCTGLDLRVLKAFDSRSSLKYLSLRGSDPLPPVLNMVMEMKWLKCINLEKNTISGSHLNRLIDLPELRTLYLGPFIDDSFNWQQARIKRSLSSLGLTNCNRHQMQCVSDLSLKSLSLTFDEESSLTVQDFGSLRQITGLGTLFVNGERFLRKDVQRSLASLEPKCKLFIDSSIAPDSWSR